MARNLFGCAEIEKAFDDFLAPLGYEWIQLEEGSLGLGKVVFLSPDDKHWNYVVREQYLNEWSSAHTIRKCAKISKALQREIDMATEI